LGFGNSAWVPSNEMSVIGYILKPLCQTWNSSIKLFQKVHYFSAGSCSNSQYHIFVTQNTHLESDYFRLSARKIYRAVAIILVTFIKCGLCECWRWVTEIYQKWISDTK
jgi:hypothetical protein